jgi:hypothetical protein
MKKVLLSLLMLTGFITASACDICGAGAGSYNPFLNPHLSRHYTSATYVHRHYQSISDEGIVSSEYYNSLLLGGQFTVGKRTQLIAAIPYQFNTLLNQYGKKKISGLGDINLLVNYKLLDKEQGKNRHTILLGAGIKLATAQYDQPLKNTGENFQLGTGSTDYLVNGTYRYGSGNWIFNVVGTYKYNTPNKNGYRFGDILTTALTVARRIAVKENSIAPYLQFSMESHMKDADSHVLQQHSGGHVCYSGGGIDLSTNRFTVGASGQFAPIQHLAGGMITVKPSFSTHISFTL